MGRPILVLALFPAVATCGDEYSADAGTSSPEPERSASAHEVAPAAEPFDPPYVVHEVLPGETLWDIARAYGVSIPEIEDASGLEPGAARRLSVGAELTIPGAYEVLEVETASDRAAALESTRERTGGILHEMARGETVWDLARVFRVSVAEIMAANGLTAEDVTRLREGQAIFVPGVELDRRGAVSQRLLPGQERALRLAERLGLGTRKAASLLLVGRARPEWIGAAGGRPGRLPGTLRWPVTKGWFVRGYGSGEGGYHLAVDIAGEIGWNVRAAAAGIVGYSGDEVSGYGNVVMVIHPGGWITLYAHNSVNFAVAGQDVRRGEVLAELGSTGISRGPHVHFELIHDGKSCDPAILFRPGVRHRSGRISPLEYTEWTRPGRRPKWVHCAPRRRYPRGDTVAEERPPGEE